MSRYYEAYLSQDANGIPAETNRQLLINLLRHSSRHVPFYARIISNRGSDFSEPYQYLRNFPILTKSRIREHFEELKSDDLALRKWTYNTSGGSTGTPARFIQDREYGDRSGAISLLYAKWIGREVGEPQAQLWGSERDILEGTIGVKAKLVGFLTNNVLLNSFRMGERQMRAYLDWLNENRPHLIIAYAQSVYTLARFAEANRIVVAPQRAIWTSAGTLHSFMRETIARVFQCPVYNFYGSREVGGVAGERPGIQGMWVAPWGNYLEIVDDQYQPVPRGTEGRILITSLTNYAMPLIRYDIGDRAIMLSEQKGIQILEHVSGRTVDMFKNKQGELVDGEYFTHLVYFRDWVKEFQVVQTACDRVVYRVIKSAHEPQPGEIQDMIEKTQVVMGDECSVEFEFVSEIVPGASGKFRYTISEINS